MNLETCVALLMFLFPLAYSPGPGNAFFAAIGGSKGVRAAVPALACYHLATFIVTALIGLGMGVTILSDPVVTRVVVAVGSVYVLWLAWSFLRSAPTKAAVSPEEAPVESRFGLLAGAVVLLLNPKAYYIVAVMFAQFLPSPLDDDLFIVLSITVIFTLNNLVAFIAWTVGGRALTAFFRSERSKGWIDNLFATVLIAVAIWMAVPLFT